MKEFLPVVMLFERPEIRPGGQPHLLWLVILMVTCPGSAVGLDCIDLPPIPSHGTFTVLGAFKAVLKCPHQNQDIALNSAGHQGALFCDPQSPFNFDLSDVPKPTCNPRLVPDKIQIHMKLGYLVPTCHGSPWEAITTDIRRLLNEHLMKHPSACGPGQHVCVADVKFLCGENWGKSHTQYKFHAQAHFTLLTYYYPEKGLKFYYDVFLQLQERTAYSDGDELTTKQKTMWHIKNTELIYQDLFAWTGACDEHANTLGTNLVLSGNLTCRGCPKKFVLRNKQCEPCTYSTYTDTPFQDQCKVCPPQHQWTNKKEMADLCFIRP